MEKRIRARRKPYSVWQIIMILVFTGLLAAAIVIQQHIVFCGDIGASYTENYMLPFYPNDIVRFSFTWILLLIAILTLRGAFSGIMLVISRKNKREIKRNHIGLVFASSMLLTMAPWLVFALTFFPGTAANDSAYILNNPIRASVQHTFFYNMLYSGIFQLGSALGGSNESGAALFTIVQLLYCSFVNACLIAWLYKKKCPIVIIGMIQAFFSLSPQVANITTVVLKDTLFSYSLLLFIPVLYDAVESDGKSLFSPGSLIVFLVASALTIWIRNNGLIVMVILASMLLVIWRKNWRLLLMLFLVSIAVPTTVDRLAMKYIVREDKIAVESLGVPIQQIAMTVVSEGEITEDQWEVIDNIMPREEIIARYAPCSVDTLKWGEGAKYMNKEYIADNMGLVLKTWAQMLPSNLSHYVRAYLLLTHGYWGINVPSTAQAYYWGYPNFSAAKYKVNPVQVWPDMMQQKLTEYYKKHTTYQCVGNLFWMLVLFVVCVLSSRNKKMVLIFIPVLSVWATLMASAPINTCFRYNYALYLSLPFLAGIVLWNGYREKMGNE